MVNKLQDNKYTSNLNFNIVWKSLVFPCFTVYSKLVLSECTITQLIWGKKIYYLIFNLYSACLLFTFYSIEFYSIRFQYFFLHFFLPGYPECLNQKKRYWFFFYHENVSGLIRLVNLLLNRTYISNLNYFVVQPNVPCNDVIPVFVSNLIMKAWFA